MVRHSQPCQLNLLAPIDNAYPEAERRFSKRLTKMLRAKARANGVKLPKGDDLKQVLTDGLWPALTAVKAHYKTLRGDKNEWTPNQGDRWILRHMRCSADELPKRMTGYGSKAVTRLFWEAMKPPAPRYNEQGSQYVETFHTLNLWRAKWAWLALLKTWLPVDFTQQILRADKVAEWHSDFTKDPAKVRRFLKQWEPRRVVRMLIDTCADGHTIRDAMRMLGECLAEEPTFDRRFRDAHEMHAWFVAERTARFQRQFQAREAARLVNLTPEQRADEERRIAAREAKDNEPLPVDYGKKIDGKTVVTPDGVAHTIITPKTGTELNAWGVAMHNCIGSYVYYVRLGECQIFGVRTEGEAGAGRCCHWGIEVRGKEIVQFRGLQNINPPEELRAAVCAVLQAAKLVTRKPTMSEVAAATELTHVGREEERAAA